jgi:hypothetical protein
MSKNVYFFLEKLVVIRSYSMTINETIKKSKTEKMRAFVLGQPVFLIIFF